MRFYNVDSLKPFTNVYANLSSSWVGYFGRNRVKGFRKEGSQVTFRCEVPTSEGPTLPAEKPPGIHDTVEILFVRTPSVLLQSSIRTQFVFMSSLEICRVA